MSDATVDGELNPPRAALASLFPLPLSDFEYYMFVDDRPTHPMVFVVAVDVAGTLSRGAFETAVSAALAVHPLFSCRIARVARRGWCWVADPQSAADIRWTEIPEPQSGEREAVSAVAAEWPDIPIQALDLQRHSGLLIEVMHRRLCGRIVFHLHHSCCDGIGALEFVGEILARYGQQTAAEAESRPEFEPPCVQKLRDRDTMDTGPAVTQRHRRSVKRVIGKVRRLLLRRPLPLRPLSAESRSSAAPVPARAIQSRMLPRSVSRGLRALAARRSVSVNDLLIREMLLQILDWNQRAGEVPSDSWLRVSVPVSMRTAQHERMPATNIVSYAFVTRRVSECRNPEELLASIHRQTSDVLYHREGIVALRFLHFLRLIPGAMKLVLGFKSCFCTVVLANVGDLRKRFSGHMPLQRNLWVAGNLTVEGICGVAPVRPNTRAAVTIGEYGGQLCVHLRTDATVISRDDTERFLAEYSERLVRLAADRHAGFSATSP